MGTAYGDAVAVGVGDSKRRLERLVSAVQSEAVQRGSGQSGVVSRDAAACPPGGPVRHRRRWGANLAGQPKNGRDKLAEMSTNTGVAARHPSGATLPEWELVGASRGRLQPGDSLAVA